MFLDVVSVISQYTLEGAVSVAAPPYGGAGQSGIPAPTVGVTGKYTDRPTITYSPLSGDRFTRSLMTPIRPDALLFLIQSGWPSDFILNITVKTINGVVGRFRNHAAFGRLALRVRRVAPSTSRSWLVPATI